MIERLNIFGGLKGAEDDQKRQAFLAGVQALSPMVPTGETLIAEYDLDGESCIIKTEDAKVLYEWSVACDSPRAVLTDTLKAVFAVIKEYY
jgi:hypothetical protein